MNESYQLFLVCCFINMKHFRWDGFGNASNSIFMLLLLASSTFYLIFVSFFYLLNFEKVADKEEHEDFHAKFNIVFSELRIRRLGKEALLYPVANLFRKFALSFTVVFLQDLPNGSLFSIEFSLLALIALLIHL